MNNLQALLMATILVSLGLHFLDDVTRWFFEMTGVPPETSIPAILGALLVTWLTDSVRIRIIRHDENDRPD